jgi:hypothetical protein
MIWFCVAFSQGIEMLSLGSFKTGAILLVSSLIVEFFCVFSG